MESKQAFLAVKVANSETEAGLFEGTRLADSWSMTTRLAGTADEIEHKLESFLEARGLPRPAGSILCSVVPAVTHTWVSALSCLAGTRPLTVGPGLKSGIAMEYKDPGQMGSDRVACALAARELYGAPVTVVDCGDATSVSVVGDSGRFLGGAIALGIGASLSALRQDSAQLPEVDAALPKRAIGRTTRDAVLSGVVLGEAARMEGLLRATWSELGYETRLVVTGPFADLVCAASSLDAVVREDLALQGLRLIYELNA